MISVTPAASRANMIAIKRRSIRETITTFSLGAMISAGRELWRRRYRRDIFPANNHWADANTASRAAGRRQRHNFFAAPQSSPFPSSIRLFAEQVVGLPFASARPAYAGSKRARSFRQLGLPVAGASLPGQPGMK